MQSQQFTPDPRLPGSTFGFKEMLLNGQRLLVHEGDTLLFHSMLALLPEQNVGLFVSYNSGGGSLARYKLLQAFLDRYYPQSAEEEGTLPSTGNSDGLDRYAGSYWLVRRSETTVVKFVNLLRIFNVRVDQDGYLLLPDHTFQLKRFVEVEPMFFRQVDGQGTAVFRTDAGGNIKHLFVNGLPWIPFEKRPWYDSLSFQYGLLGFIVLFFLINLIALPIAGLVRRIRSKERQPQPFVPRVIPWLVLAISLLGIIFLIALILEGTSLLPYMPSPGSIALLAAPLVIIALAVGLVINTVFAWSRRYGSAFDRSYVTFVALVALAFVWWMNHWNLVGFRF